MPPNDGGKGHSWFCVIKIQQAGLERGPLPGVRPSGDASQVDPSLQTQENARDGSGEAHWERWYKYRRTIDQLQQQRRHLDNATASFNTTDDLTIKASKDPFIKPQR